MDRRMAGVSASVTPPRLVTTSCRPRNPAKTWLETVRMEQSQSVSVSGSQDPSSPSTPTRITTYVLSCPSPVAAKIPNPATPHPRTRRPKTPAGVRSPARPRPRPTRPALTASQEKQTGSTGRAGRESTPGRRRRGTHAGPRGSRCHAEGRE